MHIGNHDGLTAGIRAATDGDGGIAGYPEVDSLAGAEGPSVGIVVVTAVFDLDALVVFRIEGVGGQVIGEDCAAGDDLHGGHHGIEAHVALYLVGHLDLLDGLRGADPAAE